MIHYGKRKLEEFLDKQRKLFAEGFAPGDPDGFLKAVEAQSNVKLDLDQIKNLFKQAKSNSGQFSILSAFWNHQTISYHYVKFDDSALSVPDL